MNSLVHLCLLSPVTSTAEAHVVVLPDQVDSHVHTAVCGSALHMSLMGLTCCTVIKQSLRGSEVSPFNAINSYCHLRG